MVEIKKTLIPFCYIGITCQVYPPGSEILQLYVAQTQGFK